MKGTIIFFLVILGFAFLMVKCEQYEKEHAKCGTVAEATCAGWGSSSGGGIDCAVRLKDGTIFHLRHTAVSGEYVCDR